MGNYGVEYRNYYEGLKSKAQIPQRATYSSFEEYLPSDGGRYGQRSKKPKAFGIVNNIINTFILQLVGAIILFLFVFGSKYSKNVEADKYYRYFKNRITEKVSYSDLKISVEAFKINDIIEEVQKASKWFKDRIESNPLN